MKAIRYVAGFLCLVILLASFTPQLGIPYAILFPLWFFLTIVVSVPKQRIEDPDFEQQFRVLPVLAPRPPPTR